MRNNCPNLVDELLTAKNKWVALLVASGLEGIPAFYCHFDYDQSNGYRYM